MPLLKHGSARLRLTVLLTLALLPLGVIAVLQSREMAGQAREMAERALLGETIRAAAAQREVIRTAQGQARALVPLMREAAGDRARCAALMGQVVDAAESVAFAGFLDADGRLRCTSDASVPELPDDLAGRLRGGPARVEAGPDLAGALLPEARALLVLQPVEPPPTPGDGARAEALPRPLQGGAPARGAEAGAPDDFAGPALGTILLALPRAALLSGELIPGDEDLPLELTTFTRTGDVLWSSPSAPGTIVGSPEAARAARLPADRPLTDFVGLPAHGLTARSGAGDRRTYAVVPVIEGELVTLGSWQPGSLFAAPATGPVALGVLVPLAMWGLSLVVAFVAVNRMILIPLSALRERMRAFTEGARMLPPFRLTRAPDELRHLAETFDSMTTRIVADEARLEKAVHDQEVLLKEVHHRVKNNLQLIASILNMQIRQHRTPENRAVLRRVQDRVMSLATVHQHLYQTPALSALRVDALLGEIVNRKLAEAGPLGEELDVAVRFAPVRLYPDQAVPLALLLGEAVNNVFHHVGRPPGGARPWMRIELRQGAGGLVTLDVVNTGGTSVTETQSEHRAGLGLRLIDAFASQLEGDLTREEGSAEGSPWRLRLSFTAQGFTAGEAAQGAEAAPGLAPAPDGA